VNHGIDYLLVFVAAAVAGGVNALAGGGTLITFPMLTAVGVPAVAANVTNTVALCPGYFGATLAQARDLRGQSARLWIVVPAGVAGGIVGGVLLLQTGEKAFRGLVPYLILGASLLLASQEPLKRWLSRRAGTSHGGALGSGVAGVAVALAAVYGGYFGAGLSVIVLAVLALAIDDTLVRLNGLKQAVALSTNVAAAVFFVFSGQVHWPAAAVMAAGALTGGSIGGRLAGRIAPATLRSLVVGVGLVVAVIYFVRG